MIPIKTLEGLKEPAEVFDMLSSGRQIYSNTTHLIGFEFDGTACYRKGAVAGPDDIRRQSPGIESFSPYLNHDTTEISAIDIGNLPVGRTESVENNWQQATDYFFSLTQDLDFKKDRIRFLTLGGEHSISFAPIVSYLKQYPDLVILHLDAHADLRDGYEGYHFSHAAIICRVLERMKEGQELIQYGIRSGTKEEYQWMREHKSLCCSREIFLDKVKAIGTDIPIYLTLDLDYFDPAFFPGTGTPEPGGENFFSFIQLNKILAEKNFVGADVVELAPSIDPTGNSSVFATTVVRELLLALDIANKGNIA